MTGKLYGIGVPPGDPESLTFKAARIIGKCKVIAIPGDDKKSCLAWKSVEKMIRGMQDKQILYIDMPMTKDREVLSQAHKKAAELIKRELSKGEDVAFLTIGDPGVYSTYMYIHRELEAAGFYACIINGITSFCEAAALAGIPLCEEEEELHIIPASYGVAEALDYPGAKVFMKSGSRLKEIIAEIDKKGKRYCIEVYMIENCGMDGERVYRSLGEIKKKDMSKISYFTIIIVKENRHD